MTRGLTRVATIAVFIACAYGAPVSAADVPYLTGRVMDEASIIAPDMRARLAELLKKHEDATSNQIVVLTVPTIQPESIEDYAVKVFAGLQQNLWVVSGSGS